MSHGNIATERVAEFAVDVSIPIHFHGENCHKNGNHFLSDYGKQFKIICRKYTERALCYSTDFQHGSFLNEHWVASIRRFEIQRFDSEKNKIGKENTEISWKFKLQIMLFLAIKIPISPINFRYPIKSWLENVLNIVVASCLANTWTRLAWTKSRNLGILASPCQSQRRSRTPQVGIMRQ